MSERSDKDLNNYKRIECITGMANFFIALLGGAMFLGGVFFKREEILVIGLLCFILGFLIIIGFIIKTREMRIRIGEKTNSDFYVVCLMSMSIGCFVDGIIHFLLK